MRSIRLSLVVYLTLLLALGLGAVCASFYYTTANTLREKEDKSAQLLEREFQNRCTEARADLDKRLLHQTRVLASRARSSSVFLEHLLPLGTIGAASHPQGHLTIPLWYAEGFHPNLAWKLFRMRGYSVFLVPKDEIEDPFVEDPEPAFYQVFRDGDEKLMQSSKSMGEHRFPLDEEIKKADLYTERMDQTVISGKKVRRVMFKGTVPKLLAGLYPYRPWIPGKGGGGFFPPPKPAIIESPAPTFYIVAAADLAELDSKVAGYQQDLDDDLSNLRQGTVKSLGDLRSRLVLIGLATFLGLALGGLGLMWLGLRPLNRLSEAVSHVSERDFELHLGRKPLPVELRPIADRLKVTLEQLQRAFAREKQAAADISHELRTPLAALLTNMEVTLRKNRSAEEYRDILQECRESGLQMYHLVERLLKLARLDAGAEAVKQQDVDLSVLAKQCATLVKPLAEQRGLTLRVQAETPLNLKADPDKLREVLNNLLHNAIEYNRPQGSIDLSVQRNNGHVELAVKDTGIGISPTARQHIFERFYRADPSRHADTPHAGLGLSIVKSYVDLMGGKIEVVSGEGGTTFTVALPAREQVSAA